jgi:hypothetical protein
VGRDDAKAFAPVHQNVRVHLSVAGLKNVQHVFRVGSVHKATQREEWEDFGSLIRKTTTTASKKTNKHSRDQTKTRKQIFVCSAKELHARALSYSPARSR